MKPAMIMPLTMVVVADASFGRSRSRSEPFLRRFLENFENLQKRGQKRLGNGFSAKNAYTNAYLETPGPAPTPT
jgi:hypothetical protein